MTWRGLYFGENATTSRDPPLHRNEKKSCAAAGLEETGSKIRAQSRAIAIGRSIELVGDIIRSLFSGARCLGGAISTPTGPSGPRTVHSADLLNKTLPSLAAVSLARNGLPLNGRNSRDGRGLIATIAQALITIDRGSITFYCVDFLGLSFSDKNFPQNNKAIVLILRVLACRLCLAHDFRPLRTHRARVVPQALPHRLPHRSGMARV